jgi:phosphoribosylformylglycinamidine synthase
LADVQRCGRPSRRPNVPRGGAVRAPAGLIEKLSKNGQIATQYADFSGAPTLGIENNPSSSDFAVEGITSPDGRVFAKMGHSERAGKYVHKNIPGNKEQRIFEGAVHYFTK